MKGLRCRLVAAVAALTVGQAAQAANYFSWGAEGLSGANAPQWGAGGSATGAASLRSSTAIDCAVKHSGSCSMRVTVNMLGTNESVGIDLNGTPPTYGFSVLGSQLYYRWWMRISAGFDWGDGANWGGPSVSRTKSGRQTEPGTTPVSQWYTGTVRASGFYLAECEATAGHSGACLNNDGSPGSDQGPMGVAFDMNTMADGQWHEYIVRIKYNSSASCTTPGTCDAQMQVWVDGLSVGTYTGFRLTNRDGQSYEWWGSWMTNPYFQGGSSYSAGGTIHLDDFATDDGWNSLVSVAPAQLEGRSDSSATASGSPHIPLRGPTGLHRRPR